MVYLVFSEIPCADLLLPFLEAKFVLRFSGPLLVKLLSSDQLLYHKQAPHLTVNLIFLIICLHLLDPFPKSLFLSDKNSISHD